MNVTVPFTLRTRAERRYVRPPTPLIFPEAEEVPETGVHQVLCAHLFFLVRAFVGERGAVGSDQFLYWDPTDPRKCLAPDLLVRIGAPPDLFRTWKTWERGAPHLGVEVISEFDQNRAPWSKKLQRYLSAGIEEVVRFDPADYERPLRLWDRLEGDLVERELEGENALLCDTLGVYWNVSKDAEVGQILRLARDPLGEDLIPTPVEKERSEKERERAEKEHERAAKEHERAAKERERSAKEHERAAKEHERAEKERERSAKEHERAAKERERTEKEAALARVAELEAELRRRG